MNLGALLPRFSLRRPVTVVMLLIAFSTIGVIAYMRIPYQLYPSGYNPPFLYVRVPYPNSTPKEVEFFANPEVKVISVACGRSHSLAVTSSGLYAWGSSKHGQLGLGRGHVTEQRPVLVKALADKVIVAAAAGQYHSVALDDQGRVYAWGWGVHGQLGTGDIEDLAEPRRIFLFKKRTRKVVQIACGYAHTMLMTDEGQVWAFGCSLFGQMGNGETKKVTRPQRVPGLRNERARMISSGYFTNFVITEDERIFTWGCNPQVLRLEAQQKKRERLQIARREMEERNEAAKAANSGTAASG